MIPKQLIYMHFNDTSPVGALESHQITCVFNVCANADAY